MAADSIPDPLPDLEPSGRRRPGGPALKTMTLALETITPVFGGGAVTREVDAHTPVRVSGIRGQLRFWWRALHAHACSTPRALAEREAALWGASGNATEDGKPRRSAIEIWVDDVEPPDDGPDGEPISMSARDAYALWPARGSKDGSMRVAQRWPAGLRFCLHVRVPWGEREEIEQTLRAWLLFGGIGGRTRRGCGSLRVIGEERDIWLPRAPSAGALRRLLGNVNLTGAAPGTSATDTPSLHGALLLHGKDGPNAEHAWHQALAWLRDFRQGEPRGQREADDPPYEFAREAPPPESKNRPGRSHWPEADKVRRLSGKGPWAHAPLHETRTPAWPRASFGLPIMGQFQRKDRTKERYRPGEPPDFQILWREPGAREPQDRLASPLIVKAMPLADGRFVPVALWLHRAYPQDGEVVLCTKDRHGTARVVPGSAAPFDRLRAKGDTVRYAPLNEGNMRDAFCNWLMRAPRNARRLAP